MTLLEQVQKNWKSMAVIGVILTAGIGGWNYVMAQAKDVAHTEVQATVNKEMVDGAKRAAADAVKEQLPAIAQQVAAEVVKAQKAEAAAEKKAAEKKPR